MIQCSIDQCVGCRICEVACTSYHFGAVSPALSRIRVSKLEQTGIDLAVSCISCAEKPCLDCPNEALSIGSRGQILLDVQVCSGCGACCDACPIGAVGFCDDLPLFCDLCGGEVSCVQACPTKALSCRESHSDISLRGYEPSLGSPGQRRARYAQMLGYPVRERWKSGWRIDS